MILVVDNSVAMRWLFKDGTQADRAYAERVALLVESSEVHVPALFIPEAANAIARALQTGVITRTDSAACFDLVNAMQAKVVSEDDTSAIMASTLLAFELGLTACDAS